MDMPNGTLCCDRINTKEWGHYKCLVCGADLCFFHTALWNHSEPRCTFCFSETICVKAPNDVSIETNLGNQSDNNVIIVVDGLYMAGMQKHVLDQMDVLKGYGLGVIIIATDGGGRWADKFLEKAYKVLLDFDNKLSWDYLCEEIQARTIKLVIGHLAKPIKWITDNIPDSFPSYAHFHTDPSEFELVDSSAFYESCERFNKIFFPSLTTLQLYASLFLNGSFLKYYQKLMVLPNPLPENNLEQQTRDFVKVQNQIAIVIVSRLDPDKMSVDLFWNTFDNLDELYPDFQVKVAGGGELFWELKSRLEKSYLKNKVELLGFCEYMHHLYEWADVLYLPSKREAMPYVLMESISYKKPFVAPRVGVFNNIISGSPIYIFEPGDGKKAAELIIRAYKEGFVDIHPDNHPGFISFSEWGKLLGNVYGLGDNI